MSARVEEGAPHPGSQTSMGNNAEVTASEKGSAHSTTFSRSIHNALRIVACSVGFVLPLLCWPGSAQPFSKPKFALLEVIVPAGLLLAGRRLVSGWRTLPRSLQYTLLAWLAALGTSAALGSFASRDALLLPVLGAGWFVFLLAVQPQAERLAWALVAAGTVVSAIAMVQFFSWDPFARAGWFPVLTTNARMRVYATLGNPNFVAAFLAGLLPLTASVRIPKWKGRISIILAALQFTALLMTGSRGPLLAALGVLVWLWMFRPKRWTMWLAIAALALAAGATLVTRSRSLETTMRGRLYIWSVAAPHLLEHPFLGLGPGGFSAMYPVWEVERWRNGGARELEPAFAGAQDHAHNDFLEFLTDYGIAGLTAWLAALAAILGFAWRHARGEKSPLLFGVSAGIVALCGVALVDFPFQRPTEVFFFWSLAAILFSPSASIPNSSPRREIDS